MKIDILRRTVQISGSDIQLTNAEMLILNALHKRAGETVFRQTLIQEVGYTGASSFTNLIDVHISKLRKKIGADRIETVRNEGYRMAKS